MTDETLPPTETPAGIERIDGEDYEYPYRAEDFGGRVIRDDLDTIPPFLDQEQIDILTSELIDLINVGGTENYHMQVLATVVEDLPDSEHGRGSVPDCWEVEDV